MRRGRGSAWHRGIDTEDARRWDGERAHLGEHVAFHVQVVVALGTVFDTDEALLTRDPRAECRVISLPRRGRNVERRVVEMRPKRLGERGRESGSVRAFLRPVERRRAVALPVIDAAPR